MERFHIVDDAAVILRSKGSFRQEKVFRRGDRLYAKYGTGYIGLLASGGTTLSNVSWDDIEAPGGVERPSFGWLHLTPERPAQRRRA